MADWKEITIEDVCDLGRGRVINSIEIGNNPGFYPVYSSQSYNNGEMGRINTYDFEGDYVTWTTDGAYAGTVFFRNGKFNCTNVCGTLKAKDDNVINHQFLAYKLSTVAKKYVSYIGNPKLMNNTMGAIVFEIPSDIDEQRYIAHILNTIDIAIVSTQQLVDKYKRIKTGLLRDLLTRGIDKDGNMRTETTHEFEDSPMGKIPREWICKPLSEIYSDIKSGSTPLRKNKSYFENGRHLWVKTLDLNEGEITNTQEKITDIAISESSCNVFPIDSILIAMYGGWEQIGRTGILKKEAATNQALSALFNPKMDISPEYVQFFLQYFRYKWKLYAVSTRKDPNITKTDIQNFQIFFPKDKDEQLKVVSAIQNCNKNIYYTNQNLTKLQSLKTGLMQDLLIGRVRVDMKNINKQHGTKN